MKTAPGVSLVPLEPVKVGRVLRNAAIFDFSRHQDRQSFMDADNVPAEVENFFELLDERAVPYLLVGGVAMLAHVRGRNTEDIDLILSVPEQARLQPEVTITDRNGFFALGRYGRNLRVDFLAAENPVFAYVARAHAEERLFEFMGPKGRRVRCATAEGLVLLKLYALPSLYRQFQTERVVAYEGDLTRLLAAFPQIDTEKLLTVLSEQGGMDSDAEALRKLLTDVRPKPDRFRPKI